MSTPDRIRAALIVIGLFGLFAWLFMAVRDARAGEPLTVVPPCSDWRVSPLSAGGGQLYCYSNRQRVWLSLDPKCVWQPSRNTVGRLVLTCTTGPCAGMQVIVYPRSL